VFNNLFSLNKNNFLENQQRFISYANELNHFRFCHAKQTKITIEETDKSLEKNFLKTELRNQKF
jgi:hypothetical protein